MEAWLATLRCPVVEVDGTLPIQENVERLAGRFSRPVKHKKRAAVELSRRLLFCAKTGPAEVAGPVPR